MKCSVTDLQIPECSCRSCHGELLATRLSKLDGDTGSCAGPVVVDPGATLNHDGSTAPSKAAVSPPSPGVGQLRRAA